MNGGETATGVHEVKSNASAYPAGVAEPSVFLCIDHIYLPVGNRFGSDFASNVPNGNYFTGRRRSFALIGFYFIGHRRLGVQNGDQFIGP